MIFVDENNSVLKSMKTGWVASSNDVPIERVKTGSDGTGLDNWIPEALFGRQNRNVRTRQRYRRKYVDNKYIEIKSLRWYGHVRWMNGKGD